jgi:hypothetical protein
MPLAAACSARLERSVLLPLPSMPSMLTNVGAIRG